MKRFSILAVALAAFTVSGAHANLITNGDFATDGSGWAYNNTGVDGGHRTDQGNPPGAFWINHNGSNVGTDPDPMLSQSIATILGTGYMLSFDAKEFIIGGAPGTHGLAVDIDGTEVATFELLNTWTTETVNFTAAGPATMISFRTEINGTDIDGLVDNVSVVETAPKIPLPAAGLFGLAGIGAFTILGMRRKKAA